jgi:DtxR family transcriptional regulator, Mn-dependent transcriptional regulator
MMQARKLEELLETVFTEREAGRDAAAGILERTYDGHAPDKQLDDFDELARLGLVVFDGARVALTSEGEAQALAVIRRHRLAERLLHDVLELGHEEMETNACEFEHVLSAEATESVCALLGHPPTCPHGKPIPPGACCGTYQKAVRPLVTRLAHLELGVPARIVFIAPRFHDRLDRLAALGVIPGCVIRLHQRAPAYVIDVGETTIGLDAEVAGEIYVSRRIKDTVVY